MTKKKIKVVCATQPGPNPGMACVDLAFHGVARRHFPGARVEYHQALSTDELHSVRPEPERQAPLRRIALPFEYLCSRDAAEPLWEADALVFWGDFLHMEHYLRTTANRFKRLGVAADEAQGREQALDWFFLRKAPDAALACALDFGGTLLFDRGLEQCGADYAAAFGRYMRGCAGAWMRDVYSAQRVARERGTPEALPLGSDAALLLDADTVAALPRSEWSADAQRGRGQVGLFFGRSAVQFEALAGFGQELARALGAGVHWIPWGTQHSFPMMKYTVNAPQDSPPGVEPTLGDLLDFIGRYRLIVTDTYHLSVLAWKAGVPAICIGQAFPRSPNNVNSGYAFAWRDKRQVFYAMHDALDFYCYAEELGPPQVQAQRRDALLAAVADRALVEAVSARVKAQAGAAEAVLVRALKKLL